MHLDSLGVWGTFGMLTFLPLLAPSKSHAMLLTTDMKSMPKDGIISNLEEETWSRRG